MVCRCDDGSSLHKTLRDATTEKRRFTLCCKWPSFFLISLVVRTCFKLWDPSPEIGLSYSYFHNANLFEPLRLCQNTAKRQLFYMLQQDLILLKLASTLSGRENCTKFR